MNKKRFWGFALGAAACSAALSFIMRSKGGAKKLSESFSIGSDKEEEIFFDFVSDTLLPYEEAENIAKKCAREKFGELATVVPASGKKAITVNIDAAARHCFMFGAAADTFADSPATCLFYVDSESGDVYESRGDGFVKI